MLRPVFQKPQLPRARKIPQSLGFKTKGYFDPQTPFDENYLQVKADVFKKYRSREREYVMVDDNLTKRKLALLHKLETIRVFEPLHGLTERKDFLRDYLCRKEKLEHIDAVKYRNLLLVESIKTTSLLIHSTSSCSLRRSKSRKRTSTSEVGH